MKHIKHKSLELAVGAFMGACVTQQPYLTSRYGAIVMAPTMRHAMEEIRALMVACCESEITKMRDGPYFDLILKNGAIIKFVTPRSQTLEGFQAFSGLIATELHGRPRANFLCRLRSEHPVLVEVVTRESCTRDGGADD